MNEIPPINVTLTHDTGTLATGRNSLNQKYGRSLYRVGEASPLVTFDEGRPATENSGSLSPDGRYCYWGRTDGTVLVADVNRCLEQITPFVGKVQK